jgi:hypothetical protein
MSADNGVYILKTTSEWQIDPVSGHKWSDHSTRLVCRVAELAGVDNLNWYENNQHYNMGAYLLQNWGKSHVYYTEAEAFEAAKVILAQTIKGFGICEYGIQLIDMAQYRFFGD